MNLKFLILPIAIPFISAAGIYFFPFKSSKSRNAFTAFSVILTSLCVLALIVKRPADSIVLASFGKGIDFALSLDGLGVVFLALIGFLWPAAIFYSFEYMAGEHAQERFFAFYVISYGVTAGVALSGNLITMYFFYELLTLATVPLVAHGEDRRSMKAAKKSIVYSIGGAALSFAGIMILFSLGQYGPFTFGGTVSGECENVSLLLTAYFLTFLGFGVKAAVIPLHGWLPAAGVAPTPVTALLHAVAVVKSGVFASIRSAFYAFGPVLLSGTWAQHAAIVMTCVTIVTGSALAYKEQHLKRRLAYSTVSNLSYILFGMALLTTGGLAAGLSHMLFHGIMKITLFFCAGTVLCKTGREYVPETEGLGRKMPYTFATFTIASLALVGAPLLPGFVSKMNLLNAAAELGGSYAMLGIISLLVSALLTAAYLLPLCIRAFIPHSGFTPEFTSAGKDPGPCMLVPFAVLCLVMILLGFNSRPVMSAIEALIAGA